MTRSATFILRFSQAHIEAFWRPLWKWLLLRLRCPASGFALDLDSAGFCREGNQEGARQGFNPRRQGRPSHHPLLAVLAAAPLILHGWLRSDNTGAARGVVAFFLEVLALWPEGTWGRPVRADRGFCDPALLGFLEAGQLSYIVVARMTSSLKRKCAGIKEWTPIDDHHDSGGFTVQFFSGSKARRFVVVRERGRETQEAVGRSLLAVPGDTFRVGVTRRSEGARELGCDDNGRACVEQRIEELKHDLAADGFCLQPFYATESAFLAVRCTFNLRSLDPADAAGSAARDAAGGGVPGRSGAGEDGAGDSGETVGGVGWPGQTQTAAGSHVELAKRRFAEVGSPAGPPGHRRGMIGDFGRRSRPPPRPDSGVQDQPELRSGVAYAAGTRLTDRSQVTDGQRTLRASFRVSSVSLR